MMTVKCPKLLQLKSRKVRYLGPSAQFDELIYDIENIA